MDRADDVMVVGDLHGNLPAFKQVLTIASLDLHPGRHLVLQELIHGKLMYPGERGDRSHQLVDLFAAMKCHWPERVHLILGNNELSEMTGRVIGKDELRSLIFIDGARAVFQSRMRQGPADAAQLGE